MSFDTVFKYARDNTRCNGAARSAREYLDGLRDEIDEVYNELKRNNNIYLTDELSDILWDYCNLLVQCEKEGLIDSADAVLRHGAQKYAERFDALLSGSNECWETVKKRQKVHLKGKHEKRYGTA